MKQIAASIIMAVCAALLPQFALASATNPCDVNNDGVVNVTDVNLLVSYILKPTSVASPDSYDVNNDNAVNVSDVNLVVSYILNGTKPQIETQTITVDDITFTMIKVQPGTFMMGREDPFGRSTPHQVTLTKEYWIAETEVTQALWQAIMGNNPSRDKAPDNPVQMVSWNQCQGFITLLNQKTGKTFRLPTEAEWEFAARGGRESKGYLYSGSNDVDEVAWYSGNSNNTAHPVGTKAANELGIYDMSGNVWEWCQDVYAYFTADPQTDPVGPETGSYRVFRGGCYFYDESSSELGSRNFNQPTACFVNVGFRIAM